MTIKKGNRYKTADKNSIIEVETIFDGCVHYQHRFLKEYREVTERGQMREDIFQQLTENGYLTQQ